MEINDLLKFVEFTNKFREVERQILATGTSRNENDAEHSFQLAMTAWYFIQAKELDLDINLVIQYALVHDLVETYAGDTYFTSVELAESKHDREALAAARIKEEFPEFTDLHRLVEAYEKREDPESRFVYALDKMIPVMNIYLDKGVTFRRDSITMEIVRTKDAKIAASEQVMKVWLEFLQLLERHKSELF